MVPARRGSGQRRGPWAKAGPVTEYLYMPPRVQAPAGWFHRAADQGRPGRPVAAEHTTHAKASSGRSVQKRPAKSWVCRCAGSASDPSPDEM